MTNSWKLDAAGLEHLATADDLAANVIRPAAPRTDSEARFPRETIDAMRTAGLLRLVSAGEVGGHGQGLRAAVAVCERFARECASTAMITKMHYCATAVIEKHGSEALRRSISEGGRLGTLAFSEAGSRSHFWVPVGTAAVRGDEVVLDATKQLITSAGEADWYVWSSRPAAAEGLSTIWAVASKTSGLSAPGRYEGMGLRGNASAPLHAKDVLVPAANRLGEDGKGFDVMMGIVMPWFSLQNCAISIGTMEGALERAVHHVTRSRFSYDGSAIADLPQVRGHLARARVQIDMVRGLLLDCLDAVEQGRGDATLRVLEAKVAGAETALAVTDLTMRVCGGAAYRKDTGLDRYFRDGRAATVMAPVSDALYEFIGKAVCGMPVF